MLEHLLFMPVRNLSIAMTLAGAMMLLLTSCSEEVVKTEEVIRPVKTVEIAAVEKTSTETYSGSVKARTVMNLGFRVPGKIVERSVDIGEHVVPGQVVARLDNTDLALAVISAEASVASIKQQVQTAELAYKRASTLFSQNVASKATLEQAKLAFDQATASYDSATSALNQAKNQVAYASLASDQTGIVTEIGADVGQVVGAGTTVLAVAVDGEKEVQIAVPETDINRFTVGQSVAARFWADDKLGLTGTVREVAGSADPASRTFAVRVSLPNDDRLRLGMTATIETTLAVAAPTISVPLAALAQKDGKDIVWLVNRKTETVRAQPVTVEGFSDTGAKITSGLSVGDLVVAAGTQFMRDDLKVKLSALQQSASLSDPARVVQVANR